MKVKFFDGYDIVMLEDKINQFGSTVEICDSKLTILPAPNQSHTHYVVLVMYKEKL